MSSDFDFTSNNIIQRNGQQMGYIVDDVIFAGGQFGNAHSGTQVGYVMGGDVYAGGQFGQAHSGQRIGPAILPHPRWHAAAYFLLT